MEHSRRRNHALIPVRCGQCSRYTTDPRKGLCVACVHRLRRGNQLSLGATCAVCGISDLRVLRWVKLADERGIFCANDEARLRLCQPRPLTVAQARELLPECSKDRRHRDRRSGVSDRRVHFASSGEVLRPLGGRRSSDQLSTDKVSNG